MSVLILLLQLALAAAPADLAGVYQMIPNGAILPGGLKNTGSPAEISLLPGAKRIDIAKDPAKMCQVLALSE